MLRTLRRSLAIASFGWFVALSANPAAAQYQAWIRQFGSSADDVPWGAASDGSGGVYLVGYTRGSLGGPNAGGTDAWLARFDSAGNQLWIRQLGTSGDDYGVRAASDGSGGVYISGSSSGSLGGPNAGNTDAWLARYDSSGNQIWIRQLGTSADDYSFAAAPDGSGGAYVGGWTEGNLGGPNAGGRDAWLARYDGAGNQVWILQFGLPGWDEIDAAAPDGSGGVYVGGSTDGSLGGPNAGLDDVWVAHFDGSGNQSWIRQFGTSLNDWFNAAAPDGSGGVYVGGLTGGSFGGQGAGGADAWLARYDSAGNQLWIRQFGTTAWDEIDAAAPDLSGGVYASGFTEGNLAGQNAGNGDAWLAQFDGSGNRIWIHQLGTSADDTARAVAPDGSGGVYVSGWTQGHLGGPIAGGTDTWLARSVMAPILLCEPGVGGVIACPCSNPPSGPGRGCDNSASTGGAMIQGSGLASLSADTLVFTASGERPTALSILWQGPTLFSAGAIYGQGVRCVSGQVRRICHHNASAGSVTLPNFAVGDPTISARSAALGAPILAGQSRWYLVYYRDPVVLGGCPASSTFNSGPTMRADWGP